MLPAIWNLVLDTGVLVPAGAHAPPGSVVRFRDPSFWDLYRWHVFGVLSLCVVQTVLILALLVQRARWRPARKEHKLAEEGLRESEARFQLMADAAPVLIWASGPDKGCTYFNRPWLEFTGRSLERELSKQCCTWLRNRRRHAPRRR
jgi:PAS domain-containing protein